jgi:predicted nucleotidyltransferase
MHPQIEANREAMAQACRRFCVRRLELFGSAATGDFAPATSDLDFLVEFQPAGRAQAFDNFFGLREALEALLQRPVDLVTRGSMRNRFFRANVEAHSEVVFD